MPPGFLLWSSRLVPKAQQAKEEDDENDEITDTGDLPRLTKKEMISKVLKKDNSNEEAQPQQECYSPCIFDRAPLSQNDDSNEGTPSKSQSRLTCQITPISGSVEVSFSPADTNTSSTRTSTRADTKITVITNNNNNPTTTTFITVTPPRTLNTTATAYDLYQYHNQPYQYSHPQCNNNNSPFDSPTRASAATAGVACDDSPSSPTDPDLNKVLCFASTFRARGNNGNNNNDSSIYTYNDNEESLLTTTTSGMMAPRGHSLLFPQSSLMDDDVDDEDDDDRDDDEAESASSLVAATTASSTLTVVGLALAPTSTTSNRKVRLDVAPPSPPLCNNNHKIYKLDHSLGKYKHEGGSTSGGCDGVGGDATMTMDAALNPPSLSFSSSSSTSATASNSAQTTSPPTATTPPAQQHSNPSPKLLVYEDIQFLLSGKTHTEGFVFLQGMVLDLLSENSNILHQLQSKEDQMDQLLSDLAHMHQDYRDNLVCVLSALQSKRTTTSSSKEKISKKNNNDNENPCTPNSSSRSFATEASTCTDEEDDEYEDEFGDDSDNDNDMDEEEEAANYEKKKQQLIEKLSSAVNLTGNMGSGSKNNNSSDPMTTMMQLPMMSLPVVEATKLVMDHMNGKMLHLEKQNAKLLEQVQQQQEQIDDLQAVNEARGFKIEALELQFRTLNLARSNMAKKLVDKTTHQIMAAAMKIGNSASGGIPRVVSVGGVDEDKNRLSSSSLPMFSPLSWK